MRQAFQYGLVFILGIGAGLIVRGKQWEVFFTSYIPALATLAAAYYGAKFAFQFQRDKENAEEKRHNIVEGNIAVFNLMRMAEILGNTQTQIIGKRRNHELRCLIIPAHPPFEKEAELDTKSLYFLIENEKENINLLGELSRADAAYRAAIQAMNERADYQQGVVQPTLDAAGYSYDRSYTRENFVEMLGNLIFTSISIRTDEAISSVDFAMERVMEVSMKLSARLKELYPEEKVFSFKIEAPAQQETEKPDEHS